MQVNGGTTTHYAYDGQNVAQEGHLDNGSFVADVSYLVGPRGNECRIDENTDAVRWYLYDGLGSVIGEVDEDGTVTYTAKYDVYGATRGSTGSSDSKHKFVGGIGHTSEPDTGGLIYMRARWYDPAAGRFISEDPAGDGLNWYAYCDGNPVSFADDSGNFKIEVGRLYTWKGYMFRLDKEGDIHVWFKGVMSSFYRDLTCRHGDLPPKKFLRYLAKNTNFFESAGEVAKGTLKGLACYGAISTIDGYARANPVDFIELMGELFGWGQDYDSGTEML